MAMRVVVMGGGVVGVTAAWQLLKDGHQVSLIEQHSDVAEEASWGNAGMVAPGHSFAWSSPSAPFTLLKSLALRDQALRFTPSLDPRLWTWSLKFLAQCTKGRSEYNTLRKHRLATYSQSVLREVLAEVPIAYHRIDRGILYFYRHAATLETGIAHMQILAGDGQKIEVLDRAGVLALEPSLAAVGDRIAGGIYCPTDETGSCPTFTRELARLCIAQGADFHLGETIEAIETAGDEVTGVRTSAGLVRGDAYVMALGNQSPILARRIGVDLPIYPVKGYSLTIPIGDRPNPPTIGSVDEEKLVAISRFGDHMRVTATAEFAGYDTSHQPKDFATMARTARELYPDGADHDRAEMWAGLRPMTPTNLPIIGRCRHRNLWYDTGHGHIGWTMSHGSARIVADLIAGRAPALSIDSIGDGETRP